ncbi:MAG: hypothetical protein AB7G75_29115 [Candidatus Binatia bacterium]
MDRAKDLHTTGNVALLGRLPSHDNRPAEQEDQEAEDFLVF